MTDRFPGAASTLEEIARYFTNRARQGLMEGWDWDGVVTPLTHEGVTWGARTFTTGPGGLRYQSLYVLDEHTGKGHFTRYFAAEPTPVVTAPSCEIEAFLDHKGIPYKVAGAFTQTLEYRAVEEFYGDRHAERSGVHYMNHIDEGLGVLAGIAASEAAMRAYCLHPLFQMDEDLAANARRIAEVSSDPYVAVLALEYRNVANAYLSRRTIASVDEIALSPLEDVNDMLRADKVQNYKDFVKYHDQTHARSAELHRYFRNWLRRLDVSVDSFLDLCRLLDVDGRVQVARPVSI